MHQVKFEFTKSAEQSQNKETKIVTEKYEKITEFLNSVNARGVNSFMIVAKKSVQSWIW